MPISQSPAIQFRQSVNRWVESKPIQTDDSLIVTSRLHQVDSFDAESGEKKWSVSVGEYLDRPMLAGNTILVRSSNDSSSVGPDTRNEVFGVDLTTGEVKWSHSLGYNIPQTSPDGSTYLSDTQGLTKLDSDTGDVQWSRPMTNKVAFGDDGTLIAQGHNEEYKSHLASLDPETGATKWMMPLDTYPRSIGIFGQTGVAQNSHPGREGDTDVLLFDTETGKVLHQSTSDFVGIPPQVNSKGHIVYGTGLHENTKLTSVDPKTGETLWERNVVPLNPFNTTSTLRTSETLLIDSVKFDENDIYGKALVAHDLETGDMLWSKEFDSDRSSLLGTHDGVFYFKERSPDYSGDTLVALDERTGERLWSHQTETDISGLEASGEKRILLKSEEESFRLQLFNARTGEEQWVFNTGHSLRVSGHDDGVTVVDQEGRIFELEHNPAGPYQGGPPINGATTYTGNADFYSGDPLLTTDRGLALDVNNNGVFNPGWDYTLVRDRDIDGVLTDNEIATSVDMETLQALDSDEDGLVQDKEWLGRGLYLWRDTNKDGLLSQRELRSPEERGGHIVNFDLVTQRAEFSARGRFLNGAYPDLAPPIYNTATPTLENPPTYGEGLGDKLRASLKTGLGDWSGYDGNWNGQDTETGMIADVEVAGFGGRDRYHFDFQIQGDECTLKMTRNGREQILSLDPELSVEGDYIFPYPDTKQGEASYEGGNLRFRFEDGYPFFYHSGQTPYRVSPDGRKSAQGTGGGYGYAFETKSS